MSKRGYYLGGHTVIRGGTSSLLTDGKNLDAKEKARQRTLKVEGRKRSCETVRSRRISLTSAFRVGDRPIALKVEPIGKIENSAIIVVASNVLPTAP
jgi:hypothetical protein